jgi:hypothetical protein
MAKKKAARPTAKKAKGPVKKSARKAGKSASRAAAKKATKAKKAPARKAAKPASRARTSTPARKSAKKKVAAKKASRKGSGRKPVTRASRPVRRAKTSQPGARKSALSRKTAVKAPAAKRVAAKKAATAGNPKSAAPKARAGTPGLRRIANLDRPRRTVADIHGVPSSLDLDRTASSVRSGRLELEHQIHEQTNTSPALTAGDVDADWGGASAVGDEAPGGDNPTPDQDVVEEIGRALGVEYNDDEELQGGEEIAARDRHRWELDPESSDDFDER